MKLFGGWFTWETVTGKDGSPYLTRMIIGRLRLHKFHRGDEDPEPHDHPFSFWTFPLTTYVEEVYPLQRETGDPDLTVCSINFVQCWRWTYRPARHTHRVLFPAEGRLRTMGFPFRTIVWTSPKSEKREWGFWRRDERGVTRFVHWKQFLKGR